MSTTIDRNCLIKRMEEEFPDDNVVVIRLVDLYLDDREAFNKLVERAKYDSVSEQKKSEAIEDFIEGMTLDQLILMQSIVRDRIISINANKLVNNYIDKLINIVNSI